MNVVPDVHGESLRRRHFLAIAGTGRAGTSFLVQYLAALGLDTTLSKGRPAEWFEEANAGLENLPIVTPTHDLPYVVKTPWLAEFIDQLLAQPDIAIDAVIVPVRDIVEASSSRVIQEMRSVHQQVPSFAAFDRSFEAWGQTPGGVVYSLNPLDQARILAMQFHKLVQRLVDEDVPIVFLSFPRLVEDADYLFKKLQPVLPAGVTHEQAVAAHSTLAKAKLVRVAGELASEKTRAGAAQSEGFPNHEAGFDRDASGDRPSDGGPRRAP